VRERLNDINMNLILKNKSAKTCEIDENLPVFEAVKLMADRNMGSLLVVRKGAKGKELAGIFTERDYIRKIILK
jgi:CBS domain-containing protein